MTTKLTIFEGPDGGGKTTLLNRWPVDGFWSSAHGPYLDCSGTYIAKKYLASIEHAVNEKTHVLMDRSWISEAVYGPLARGADRIDVAHRRVLERMALSAGGIVIICLPSYEMCKRTYLRRRDAEYLADEATLSLVYDKYQEFIVESLFPRGWGTALPVFHYDYENSDARDFSEFVEPRRPAINQGPGVGSWRPGEVTLMVGEQLADEYAAPYPFCDWKPGGCSGWLAQRLEERDVSECGLYWVNALQPDGKETDVRFIDVLRPRRVVAMGGLAWAWCARNGVKDWYFPDGYREIPHPQWWKRFRHGATYQPLVEAFS